MADKLSREKRSWLMSRITSKHTKPEIIVRKFLHAAGFRYRLHDKGLPGKPDIVLPKYKAAIFVHGCFWHGHTDCSIGHIPKTRVDYWEGKIGGNQRRHDLVTKELLALGWRIYTIWECELKPKEAAINLEKLSVGIRTTK